MAEPTNIYWYPNIPAIQAEFVWKYLDEYYDIRYLKTHGNEIGYFWDGYNLRPVEGNVWQASTHEDDFVCKWGRISGYGCGYVEIPFYGPLHVGCGNPHGYSAAR